MNVLYSTEKRVGHLVLQPYSIPSLQWFILLENAKPKHLSHSDFLRLLNPMFLCVNKPEYQPIYVQESSYFFFFKIKVLDIFDDKLFSDFDWIGPTFAISICVSVWMSVCLRHQVQFFPRPLIGPEFTWSVPGLSLVLPLALFVTI